MISISIKNHSENDQATADFSMCICCTLGVSAKRVVIFCYCREGLHGGGRFLKHTIGSNSFHCTQNVFSFITVKKRFEKYQI